MAARKAKKSKFKIGVLDFETDPFLFGRVPRPFAAEFYSDTHTIVKWGTACADEIIEAINELPDEYLIFAHNGGKFDFHFIHKFLDNPIKIINSRIVSAKIGKHTMRDSFAIIPVPLKATGSKLDIDYSKMEADKREAHKAEILEYLHADCLSLYSYVAPFVERFGTKMTVGSTAMTQIKKRHDFGKMTGEGDAAFRPYYFGGRVQCFQSGILPGPWKCYDVNSMYPKVMRDRRHPVNCSFDVSAKMPDNFDMPFFLRFRGKNRGALPVRTDNELTFDCPEGEFFACSHEIEVALKYGLIDIQEVIECYVAQEYIVFDTYVDDFYKEKTEGKRNGDRISEQFAKFMLNSGYGKFGQDPANFSDWLINREIGRDQELWDAGYTCEIEYDEFELWSKPADIDEGSYYDVSIAASITSGARATLLEGIQQAEEPIYCDTDSLICRSFRGQVDKEILGAWKHEWDAPNVAIAGKKMYAAYNAIKDKPIKLVSKGGTLTLRDILDICRGKHVEFANPAPTFSLYRPTKFITRHFKMTVDNDNEVWDYTEPE